MFPTWPAKSELKSGNDIYKQLAATNTATTAAAADANKRMAERESRGEEQRWGQSMMESRQMAMGPGFSLKF